MQRKKAVSESDSKKKPISETGTRKMKQAFELTPGKKQCFWDCRLKKSGLSLTLRLRESMCSVTGATKEKQSLELMTIKTRLVFLTGENQVHTSCRTARIPRPV